MNNTCHSPRYRPMIASDYTMKITAHDTWPAARTAALLSAPPPPGLVPARSPPAGHEAPVSRAPRDRKTFGAIRRRNYKSMSVILTLHHVLCGLNWTQACTGEDAASPLRPHALARPHASALHRPLRPTAAQRLERGASCSPMHVATAVTVWNVVSLDGARCAAQCTSAAPAGEKCVRPARHCAAHTWTQTSG